MGVRRGSPCGGRWLARPVPEDDMSWIRFKGLGALLAALAVAAASPVPAAAQELTPMRIGVLRIASQAPFFVGVERGYFTEAGIDAELVFFDAAVPATLAIVSRDVDIAVIGFTPAFFNLAANGGITVVAGHSREAPGYHNTGIYASNAAWNAGVRSMADLAGRSIGLTTIGSTNHYAVARIAEIHGFDINRSRLVPAQGLGNLAAMLTGNQVDVAAGAGTSFMPLVEAGSAHLIGWAGDELSWQLGGLASSPRVVAEKRAAIQAVVDVYERGAAEYWEWLLERNPDGSFKDQAKADELLAITASYTSVPPAALAQSLAYIDSRLDVGSIFEMVEWYRDEGMIEARTDPRTFIDLSFVEGHENVPAEMAAER
jgi:NitT/TauT family transport system substrate-binding protein